MYLAVVIVHFSPWRPIHSGFTWFNVPLANGFRSRSVEERSKTSVGHLVCRATVQSVSSHQASGLAVCMERGADRSRI